MNSHTWAYVGIHRARSGRVLSAVSSVPMELGWAILRYMDVFTNLKGL